MASVERSAWGIYLSADDEGCETLTRWECVKLACSLVWNACLRLPPKPAPRAFPPLHPTAALIMDRALEVLFTKSSFLDKINVAYDERLGAAKRGDTVKFRPIHPFEPRKP